MAGFKERVAADINTFIDLDYFAEVRNVTFGKDDIRPVKMVVDDDKLAEGKSGMSDAMAEATLLFYAATEDLPERRGPGSSLTIDNKHYIVTSWTENMGVSCVACAKHGGA